MSKQLAFDTKEKKTLDSVETYKFEPIQGYPMLHWKGKRPFQSTQYYPAQLKEVHGEPVDGWLNEIYWGDNLQVMSHLLKKYRGKIKLVYIDPPFDSKADYKMIIKLKGQEIQNNYTVFEESQYSDIWTNDEYLQFMYERLVLIRELLSDDGSIYLHCDYRKSHHLRCLLDEVFGPNNFLNEILWQRSTTVGSSKAIASRFPTLSDTIFLYVKKSDKYFFNKLYTPPSDEYKARFKNQDDRGLYYWNTLASYSEETYQQLKKEGRVRWTEGAKFPQYKTYLHELKGNVISNVWTDINMLNPMAEERQDINYPTQKPLQLLERIIESSSESGDIIFDAFMGSGTAQASAMKLGRRFIGCDINLGAIQITTRRLLQLASELNHQNGHQNDKPVKCYTGFSVYNVNNYDIFRNPVQAKDLLKEALEINPFNRNSIYDGEKDGKMVKIMPVNRIATRADLNGLLTGFDQKTFEKRKEAHPNKPVEKLLLVCMGHEPDLAAYLEKEVQEMGFKIDVEVVDILRDKANLEFKRDSEAKIKIKKGKLVIENFYPLNLLQKLSLLKENVDDWRELVESVMIDWNYNGTVFKPAVVDVPEKNELVAGSYNVPEDAETIRVKITDLLSESLEVEVQNE
jgi:site-specific DNA-methyltransferase (adenine-specific)/adenine-specific DNA-methyltransferase